MQLSFCVSGLPAKHRIEMVYCRRPVNGFLGIAPSCRRLTVAT
ncbi:MAG: hypothetical protein QFX35_07450 [Candidatus Verstraetearchaeota archaeon]|nr:hypothetical protein [Candidatus Verstraetearchaeota archaeon]